MGRDHEEDFVLELDLLLLNGVVQVVDVGVGLLEVEHHMFEFLDGFLLPGILLGLFLSLRLSLVLVLMLGSYKAEEGPLIVSQRFCIHLHSVGMPQSVQGLLKEMEFLRVLHLLVNLVSVFRISELCPLRLLDFLVDEGLVLLLGQVFGKLIEHLVPSQSI